MEEKYKKITIQGRLKSGEPLKINWFDNEIKNIECPDFMFILTDKFFEKYKQIQDLNNLEFLKIIKIEELTSTYEEIY